MLKSEPGLVAFYDIRPRNEEEEEDFAQTLRSVARELIPFLALGAGNPIKPINSN